MGQNDREETAAGDGTGVDPADEAEREDGDDEVVPGGDDDGDGTGEPPAEEVKPGGDDDGDEDKPVDDGQEEPG